MSAEPRARCPVDGDWAAALQLEDPEAWLLACEPGPGGKLLVAALRLPEEPKQSAVLVVAVTATKQETQRAEFKLEGKQFDKWEEPKLRISADKLGDRPVLRIAYFTQTGEDYYSDSETVTFVVAAGKGLQHVWTGSGSSSSRSMDLCYRVSTARFSLSQDGGSLQRTVRNVYSINRANYDSKLPVLRDLVKGCRGAPTATNTFPLKVRLRD